MNKTIKVFPLLLVFVLNFALFISTPYSKTILNVFPMSDCIWSTIYFFVVFLGFNYYIYCYFINPYMYNRKKAVLLFFILFGIRVIFDLTYCLFNDTLTKNIYTLFADFIFDIFFVYIILKVNIKENIFKDILKKIIQKDIRTIIACALIAISFSITLILLLSKYSSLCFCNDKYTKDSAFYTFNNMRFIFESEFSRMLFTCISEATILYICNIMYFSAVEKKIFSVRKVAIVVIRVIISINIIFFAILIKFLVNSTGICNFYHSTSKEYSENVKITGHNIYENLIFRSNVNKKDYLCYEKTNVNITQMDNIIFSFELNNFSKHKLSNKNIFQCGLKNSVMLSNTEVNFYSNQYIVFVENTIPQVISFNDICNINENDIITEFLEKMITYGYWDFFEYGCEYLLKYDQNFITPYINRYSVGEFTENEKSINTDIREEYMIKFSSDKL